MALAAARADYLFLGPLLVQRLQAQLGDQVEIRPVDDLQQVVDGNLTRTAVFVLWFGERPTDTAGNGSSTLMEQRWLVLVAVKSAAQQTGAKFNTEAGALLAQVHRAVTGWGPEEAAQKTFTRVSGINPRYLPGKALYPLTFAITVSL